MAKAAQRASAKTVLKLGQVEVGIALYASADKPGGVVKFDQAGPSGGVLEAQTLARPVPADASPVDAPSQPVSDPFADDPGRWAPAASALPETAPGEYARQLVERGTGEVVAPDQVRKGVRLDNGEFVDCTAQLAAIEERTRLDRAVVVGFTPVSSVARARVKAAQYVGVTEAGGAKALRLMFEAMRASRRVAIVKLTKRSRQTLGVIGWYGDALMLYELVWAEDMRPAPPAARAIQQATVSPREVEMARELVDAMSVGVSALDELRDDAIDLREQLRAAALAGEVERIEVSPELAPTDELEALLARSLAETRA